MSEKNITILFVFGLIILIYPIWIAISYTSRKVEQDIVKNATRVTASIDVHAYITELKLEYPTYECNEGIEIDDLTLEKTSSKESSSLHVFHSNVECKYSSFQGNGLSYRKFGFQDLIEDENKSLGDLFGLRIPNTAIYDSSSSFVYPVSQDLSFSESVGIQESYTEMDEDIINPDNAASGAGLPVQATDATENDVYIHPVLADREGQNRLHVELDAEGAVGGDVESANSDSSFEIISFNWDDFPANAVIPAGIFRQNPHFPRYGSYQDRQLTFANQLATNAFRDTQALVDAGFFFTGHNDCVCCFQCGIRLQNWQAEDNPEDIHRQFSPHCDFLHVEHGAAYAQGIPCLEMPFVDLHSPRITRTLYQHVLLEVRRLGYEWDDVHKALLEHVRRGLSLDDLGTYHIQSILVEWGTPLSSESLEENNRLRRRRAA